MNKKFPPEFQEYFRDPRTKAAWVSDYDGPNLTGCENCGGSGFFVLTIGTDGPFATPPPPKVVSHYSNGKWWAVTSVISECPVCHNGKNAANKPIVYVPDVARRIKQTAEAMAP